MPLRQVFVSLLTVCFTVLLHHWCGPDLCVMEQSLVAGLQVVSLVPLTHCLAGSGRCLDPCKSATYQYTTHSSHCTYLFGHITYSDCYLQSHPVRVCKVPQRPGLHLAAPSQDPLEPALLLAVQPLHVDLWQTGCTAGNTSGKVNQDLTCAYVPFKKG